MPYVYQADLWCDSCGQQIHKDLVRRGKLPKTKRISYDSDKAPVLSDADTEVSDSIYHCASRDKCLEPIDLGDWGLAPRAKLHGAETRKIGALITEHLTREGVAGLKQMLAKPTQTPYQQALHNFWEAAFADDLA